MEANQDKVPGSDTTILKLLSSSRKTRVTVIVLVVEFFLNILVASLKLIVGFGLGSLSMIADGYHSLLDGASNIIGVVGILAASRPPDSNHPYGHGKFETLASMAIGITLFFAAYEVISATINRVIDEGVDPAVSGVAFAVMIGTMIFNGTISFVEWKIGKKVGSRILISDSAHTRSDVFVSLSVIFSLFAVQMNFAWIDPIVATAIAGFICYTGWKILSEGIMSVSDVVAIPPEKIREICKEFEGVHDAEQIRTRYHSDSIFLDLIVVVRPDQTVKESHALMDRLEARIIEKYPDVRDILIHVEPEGLERRSPGRPRISAAGPEEGPPPRSPPPPAGDS
ncbi:MAG: cation diffusion facilitator family transporter [Planctomycetota bacterium]|nr:cation diffusion facilitator family transporter [Planctomycetota bacterium]